MIAWPLRRHGIGRHGIDLVLCHSSKRVQEWFDILDVSQSNRNYQPFPLLSYFSVVVCQRCLLHHILSRIAYTFRESWDFVFIIIVQFVISANSRIRYGLQIVFVCLYITPSHYHHCANLSVDIEIMICLPDIFCRVYEKDWAYSLSYPLFNIRGCMFSVYPIPSWWLR